MNQIMSKHISCRSWQQIWKAQTLGMTADGSTNIYHLVNFTWNGELSENPVCFLFNAYKSYTHGPQVDGRFTRICSNGVWDDVTGGSGVTSGPRTTASASSPPVSNIPTTTTTTISTTTVAQGNTPVSKLPLQWLQSRRRSQYSLLVRL